MGMDLYLPSGYYLASLLFTGTGVPKGAAMTFGGAQNVGVSTPATIASTIAAAWATHLDASVNSVITLASVRVKFGPLDSGPFVISSVANQGGSVGVAAPPNTAFLIRKNTAIGGKHGSGRMYMPGVAEANVDEAGKVLSSFRTTLQTAWDGFYGALDSASIDMYLLHNFGSYVNRKGKTIVVAQREPDRITSLSVSDTIGTQRRRVRRT